jgi:hypothetical protein
VSWPKATAMVESRKNMQQEETRIETSGEP